MIGFSFFQLAHYRLLNVLIYIRLLQKSNKPEMLHADNDPAIKVYSRPSDSAETNDYRLTLRERCTRGKSLFYPYLRAD